MQRMSGPRGMGPMGPGPQVESLMLSTWFLLLLFEILVCSVLFICLFFNLVVCIYPELWWWHEASTQHHGSWYARSEHVSSLC